MTVLPVGARAPHKGASMDEATISRLIGEHPEQYRGGRIDYHRLRDQVSVTTAWESAERCLAEGTEWRAAYWIGFATIGEN